MPKFDVRIGQIISEYQIAYIQVEAENETEAKEIAENKIMAGETENLEFYSKETSYGEGGEQEAEEATLIEG